MRTDPIVKNTVALSLVEVGLGGVLHALRVPLAGHFLSLNQGAFLTRVTSMTGTASSALTVSNLTAVLKSLSPAGKKLTPMLALSAQGLLYFFGVMTLGVNLAGQMMGMILLSLWAFLQPLILYYFLFGKKLIEVGLYFFEQIQQIVPIQFEYVVYGVLILVILKCAVGALSVFWVRKLSEAQVKAWGDKLIQIYAVKVPPKSTPKSLAHQVARELLRPVFVLSLAMTLVFILITKDSGVNMVWVLLRPLALGFLLFGLVKFIPFEKFLMKTARENTFQFYLAESLKQLKERM